MKSKQLNITDQKAGDKLQLMIVKLQNVITPMHRVCFDQYQVPFTLRKYFVTYEYETI